MSVDLFEIEGECGCAAKVPADQLSCILKDVELPGNPALLIGPETLDDAGVYQISDTECLVQTVDFFPPVARDPFVYGQIAAANSLSDIYAMGGNPLTAMAIVCFPAKTLGMEILKEMISGAVDKLKEAGAVLLGGHSIVDPQPKFGLAVTGMVNPREILSNAHAEAGDALILTKPLGTGITIMAAKAGMAGKMHENEANKHMSTLNADASQIARKYGATSCTDITGFGFLGHVYQLAEASGVSLDVYFDSIPRLPDVLEYAAMGLLSGAVYSNRKYVGDNVEFDKDIELAEQDLLFDPQTSGGLLFSCPEANLEEMMKSREQFLSTPCKLVGKVLAKADKPVIRVKRA